MRHMHAVATAGGMAANGSQSVLVSVMRMASEMTADWNRDWRRPVRWLLREPFRQQTLWNLAYLVFGLPLGLLYTGLMFLIFLIGFVTIPVLIGIPILVIGAAMTRWANGFERQLAWRWLGVGIPAPRSGQGLALSARASRFIRDPVTWTSILFLVLKIPIGAGACWAIYLMIDRIWTLLLHPLLVAISPVYGSRDPATVLAGLVVGIALIWPALHAVNLMAYLYGRFARLSLGPSDATLRVELSQAEAERERQNAEKAEQSRRELMVNVSHELRTPVASIRGHVESLMIAAEDDAEAGHQVSGEALNNYLGIIHRETERLGALVDDLMALARSEAGELRLTLRPVEADAVIHEVHETLAPLAWRDRSVTVVADLPERVPLVQADRDRLTQVLLNLVRNAITHTPAGGIVSMSVSQDGADGRPDPRYVTIMVADTGAGIPAEDLDRIFERFYRVDASRNRASGGFGLGLSIVHDLVSAMGGAIDAESVVGQGSVFRVRLQRAPSGARPERSAIPSSSPNEKRDPHPEPVDQGVLTR